MPSPGGQEVGRVSIRVLPDTSDFRRRLRGDLESATAGMEARVPINVDLDTAGVTARMRALMGQLRAQAAGGVDINVGVNRQNGLSGIVQSLRGLNSGASGASGSVGGLTSNIFLLVAVLALVGPLITLVGGLLAGLPSLLVGFGAAVGVIALGFDGIKRAASSLGPPIDALKESLSKTFEQRLTPQFEKLAGFLPALQYGFRDIANGLADMSQGFIDTITSADGFVKITGILRDTGKLFSNLKPFASSMTDAFLQLASSGAGAFGYLSTSANRFGEIFKTTVAQLANDGSLDRAMKGLSQVFDGLGDAFNYVFDAAVRTMPALGRQLKITLREFGIGIADALPGLVAFGDILLSMFAAAGRAVGGFLKGAGPALTRLADSLSRNFAGAGADAVASFAERVGAKFGEFVDWLREQIPTIVRTIGDFFNALAGNDTLNPEGKGAKFGQSIRDFFGWLKSFWDENGDQIIAGVGALAGAITNAAPAIATFVGYFASAASFIGSAKDRFNEFKEAVSSFVGDNVSLTIRVIGDAFNYVKTKVSEAIGAVSSFASSAVSALQSAGQQMLSAIQTAWSAIVSTVNQKIGEVVSAVTALGGKITGALSGLAGQMVSIGVQIIQGLINGITSMAQSVASAAAGVVKGAINAAKSALGIHSPSKVFAEFGRYSAVGYINGLEGEGSSVDKAGDRFGDRVADSLRKQVPTIDQAWADALEQAKVGEIPGKFFEAAGSELLSDIGISTDGALGELVKQITQHNNNSTTTYIVQDLDEAQRKERNKQRKDSLQHTRR